MSENAETPRFTLSGGALIETFVATPDEPRDAPLVPHGDWVRASDYDALRARLDAPCPDVEAEIYLAGDIRGMKYPLTEVVPASLARALAQRLADALQHKRVLHEQWKMRCETAERALEQKENDRQYHMNAINRLAKATNSLGETSNEIVSRVIVDFTATQSALKTAREDAAIGAYVREQLTGGPQHIIDSVRISHRDVSAIRARSQGGSENG